MSAQRYAGPTIRTDSQLRTALARWLETEEGEQDRLEAIRTVVEVAALAEEVLAQRVLEARAFNRSWAEIAAAVGVTRQSAYRRWRHLDDAAAALSAERERQFRTTRPRQPARPPPMPWEHGDGR